MTCIVGIEHRGGVILGADSLASASDWTCHIESTSKLVRSDAYIFGFTSSFRMGDILRHHVALPGPPAGATEGKLLRHMVRAVVPVLRAAFKDGGWATTKDGAEVGGHFPIGVGGRLFCVQSEYQVLRSAHGYAAVGVCDGIAKGALAATEGQPPRVRLRKALLAAERHCVGVRGPFRFMSGRPITRAP